MKALSSKKLEQKHLNKVIEKINNTFNISLYPVQIKAIKEMLKGNIINVETGEGKTNIIIATAIVKALMGESVVVITSNDYLNERDYNLCKLVTEGFGVNVSLNGENSLKDIDSKRKVYNANIIYSTASEFIFDYLRGKNNIEFLLLLLYKSLIIDEIDQILVDNSHTNYSLSYGEDTFVSEEQLSLYSFSNLISKSLKGGKITVFSRNYEIEEDNEFDFIFNVNEKMLFLTNKGEKRIKKILRLGIKENLNIYILSSVLNTLQALYIYTKGIDYLITDDNKLSIIDSNNGRYKPNNHYSSGLNLALEIKEGLEISCVYENEESINGLFFFSQFEKLVGCSGTSYECKRIFEDILNTTVKKIKRNKVKSIVINRSKYYLNKKEKYKEVFELIKRLRKKALPLLIIAENDNISNEFTKLCRKKYDNVQELVNDTLDREDDILKLSGLKDSILVSNLISGRGIDIKIDEYMSLQGGLQIIFLTRFNNVRVEKQIIGRTGRQGLNGEIYFFSSLDDTVYCNANPKEIMKIKKSLKNNKFNKIDKKIEIFQKRYNNYLLNKITLLYKNNIIVNLFSNYIENKVIDKSMVKYDIEMYIKSHNLNTNKDFYNCILDTRKYVCRDILKGQVKGM